MLKKCISIANAFIYSIISQFCDTCDREKCKTPVYVRARASKKSILAFIAITLSVKMMNLQNPHFYSPPHQKSPPQKLPLQPMWRFLINNVSFFFKQRVVFLQTTCRFPSNNVLFSPKQRVVFSHLQCRSS